MSALVVDAALDGPFEKPGRLIAASGEEDSSGYRRMLASRLARNELEQVALSLRITVTEAAALRDEFVQAFGGPV